MPLQNLVSADPVYDFVAEDNIRHELLIDNASTVSKLEKIFSDVPSYM